MNAQPAPDRPLKFILFPLGWLLAHVGRLVEIGKALRARGHEVIFAGEDPANSRSRMSIAQKEGFPCIRAKECNHPYAWDRFVKYGWWITPVDMLRHHHWAPLDEIIDDHVQLMMRERPDMVVGDGSISVSTAAYITKTPAAGVMNAYAGHFVRPGSFTMPLIYCWDRFQLARERLRVYRKYNCRPVNAIRLLKSIPLISPDLPELDKSTAHWKNWRPVGPILFEPPSSLPEWFNKINDGTPNIYLTMGSTGLMDRVLRRSYETLARAPYRFLITAAGQVSEETKAMAPPNFCITEYAPGSRILEHCRALIFHGGNGTMYQGLAAGVPMIALPTQLEQSLCADIAVKHGFGMKMSPRFVNGRKLLNALNWVMSDPRYRRAAKRYSGLVRNADGAGHAADILEATAREGKPAGHDLISRA